MILNKEILQKYKDFLILFDYPFIKQQNDVEIQKIFDNDNRILLLSWLIVKFLPSSTNKIEDAKKDTKIENVLTNMIYENGFCRSTEKDPFVKGTLDDDKQITIFDRIFCMLSLLHSNDSSTQENMSEEDLKLKQLFMKPSEELKDRIIPPLNLFPTLSLPNKMTNTERQNKMDRLKEELDNLKNIYEMEEKNNEISNTEIVSSAKCNPEEVVDLVGKLKKSLNEFNNDEFINFTKNKTEIVTSSNKPELEKYVAVNSKEISSLLKTLEKKQQLKKIMQEENVLENDESIPVDFSASIRQFFVMSNNIIEEAKRNSEN